MISLHFYIIIHSTGCPNLSDELTFLYPSPICSNTRNTLISLHSSPECPNIND